MRAITVLLLVGNGICAAASAMADEFPYEAYVVTDRTDVVAGPGHRFYATDRLARGEKVEIYREEASGWLAIRPPEGSFSWVPGEYVEKLDELKGDEAKLGRVKKATGAWIGTSVEHVSEHQQQITLKAGELVEILAEKGVNAGGGKEQTWLKIAPPAGEYRWVHLRDVSRQKPEEPMPALIALAESETVEQATVSPVVSLRESEKEDRTVRFDRQVEPAQFQRTTSGGESRGVSPDGFVPRKRRDTDEPRQANAVTGARPNLDPSARFAAATPVRSLPATGGSGNSSRSGLSSDEISRQLDQIEVDLSLMIAQDRSQWNLAGLRKRVDTLVESGADPRSRGRARLVLDKIKQFEDAFDARSVGPSDRGAGTLASAATAGNSLADPRYDAQGWLKPVVSRKGDKSASPFAVVDSEGQPLCFISPSPGLNLNRYLNKQVGLYGRRGYVEELKKPHLMAERVVEIDSHLR